ncbi:MAG: type II toxin-antitoxin system ParD family antitoxin [Steroidobacteraceae bacterium]
MGRVTSFSLGDHFTSFVEAQVKEGRYAEAENEGAMTGHFVLTPRAQTDLDEIWDYTADHWGAFQATSVNVVSVNEPMRHFESGSMCSHAGKLLRLHHRRLSPASARGLAGTNLIRS